MAQARPPKNRGKFIFDRGEGEFLLRMLCERSRKWFISVQYS